MNFRLRHPREASLVCLWGLVFVLVGCLQAWAGCDEAPAGQTFRIRLAQPISSYSSKAGSPVRGILLESPECDGVPLFSLGTEVEGRVKSVQKVGMGFRHEAAALELEFDWISPDDGASIQMRTRVMGVDNARETIKNGVIHGIRSSDALQGQVFFRLAHFPVWDPVSYWVSAFSQSVFPIAPEPEINLPPGTDLSLELTEPLLVDGSIPLPRENRQLDASESAALDEKVQSFAERTYNTKGREADVVNLLFVGSADQIQDAFRVAGWKSSDPLSTRSILREFHAVFSMNNYPHLPMANHLLDGRLDDWSLEKGFDSYQKRDHLRIWDVPDTFEGQPIWLSAATGETGAGWSIRTGKFEHHVQPNLDEEREKVVRDLTMAGCVGTVHVSPRPDMPHDLIGSTGTVMQTDGSVEVVQLKDCRSLVPEDSDLAAPIATRPRSKFARLVRTQVLSLRNIWRDNIVYDAFDLSRAGVHALHNDHRRSEVRSEAALSLSMREP
jgi:hypothetical protein